MLHLIDVHECNSNSPFSNSSSLPSDWQLWLEPCNQNRVNNANFIALNCANLGQILSVSAACLLTFKKRTHLLNSTVLSLLVGYSIRQQLHSSSTIIQFKTKLVFSLFYCSQSFKHKFTYAWQKKKAEDKCTNTILTHNSNYAFHEPVKRSEREEKKILSNCRPFSFWHFWCVCVSVQVFSVSFFLKKAHFRNVQVNIIYCHKTLNCMPVFADIH